MEFDNTFNSFPRAWLAIFVLSTTENFPFLMYVRRGGLLKYSLYRSLYYK